MVSQEALIARKLSGLAFVMKPEIREEIHQSITDYFLDEDEDGECGVSLTQFHD